MLEVREVMTIRKDWCFPISMFQQIELLLKEQGSYISLSDFLGRLSVTEEEFRDPKFSFNGDHLVTMYRSMEKTSKLKLPVLDILRHFSATNLGVVGLAGASAPTLKRAIDLIINFHTLYVPSLKFEFFKREANSWIQATSVDDLDGTDYMLIEMALGALKAMSDDITGHTLPMTLEFSHGQCAAHKTDDYVEEYCNFFQCEVKFNCSHNRIYFPSKGLEYTTIKANEVTYRYAENQLNRDVLKSTDKETLADKAKYIIIKLMANRSPSDLASVASELLMAPRTLSRKLAKLETSFNHLLNEVRINKSKELLLRTDLSIKLIAYDVGYKNSDSFSRAFKSQTGRSPTNWKDKYG